jgi:uncharacterized membrane protein
MMNTVLHAEIVWIIMFAAVATFVTRIGGYLLITGLKTIPPRLEAALNAVPAAVLSTLVAPSFITGGLDVKLALVAAFIAGFRFKSLPIMALGWIIVMVLRASHLV